MQKRTTLTVAALALILGLGQAQAQNLRDGATPAEFPPASYTGKQYVDSKGCVFVRAGFDGAINWVPRVNRKRKVLCGMSPTFAGRPAQATPPLVASAPPRAVTPPRTVSAPPRTVTPPPVRKVTAPVRTAAPTYSAPRVVTAPTRGTNSCANMSALSQRYMQTNTRHAVRCGPQGTSPTGISYDGSVQYNGQAIPVVRVTPPPRIAPPEGYKSVWEDDRLNPNRGVQTAEGYYQSSLVWTNTVPRRLIDKRTRRDITDLFPFLKWPELPTRTMAEQVAYRGHVADSARGRVVHVTGTPVRPTRLSTKNVPATQPATRLSTKAVPPTRDVAAPSPKAVAVTPGHRYVQVGTFTNPSNAQNSAARLQRMGLPVRIGTYQKAGKSYKIVLAGPFNSLGKLAGGLVAARRAGFTDAYTRK